MRFIFHNPHHSYWFKRPAGYTPGKKSTHKYEYIFDHFYTKYGNVYVYIDKYKPSGTWYAFRNFIPPIFGFYAWVFRNRLNPFRINIVSDIQKTNSDDILFSFLYGTYTNTDGVLSSNRLQSNDQIKKSRAFKLVHLTHYFYHADVGSLNSGPNGVDLFIAESNLFRNSSYFRKHYEWYRKDVYVLPFVPNHKFINNKPFTERKNRAIAMGTITTPIDDTVFFEHFGHTIIQPGRVSIFENREKLGGVIDSFISPINEVRPGTLSTVHGQPQYRSMNIVEKYNDYKMFIVPEEISGLPGIGFAEGMMCGAAFIGLNDQMYEEYGLEDKINFIAYDGTLSDLISKIDYYRDRQEELKEIAKNGCSLARRMFNGKLVIENLLSHINSKIANKN